MNRELKKELRRMAYWMIRNHKPTPDNYEWYTFKSKSGRVVLTVYKSGHAHFALSGNDIAVPFGLLWGFGFMHEVKRRFGDAKDQRFLDLIESLQQDGAFA